MTTVSPGPIPDVLIEPIVRLALQEDLVPAGDVTTDSVVAAETQVELVIRSREHGVLAGIDAAQLSIKLIDREVACDWLVPEGTALHPHEIIGVLRGNARSILMAERTVLNFLGHLSGIATSTASHVAAIADTSARVTCTRKTTPGLRLLEKRAVLIGGGVNHRHSLGDAVLIKDNHIFAAGGVSAALERARSNAGHMRVIEIEVDTLDQLREALPFKPNCILLDNMPLNELREAVAMTGGGCVLEASGSVNLNTIRDIATTGVDYISVGSLTHRLRRIDFGLDAM
jgi:nicotinate-nucleotide pyrophosphorylase (carboxylating)